MFVEVSQDIPVHRALPVVHIVGSALAEAWHHRFYARHLCIPAVLMLCIQLFFGAENNPAWWVIGVGWIISGAAFVWFAVSCHRLVLLGEVAVPVYGLHTWTWRETRFCGWISLVYLLAYMIFALLLLLWSALDFGFGYSVIAFIVAGIWPAHLFSRFSMMLPGVAIDDVHDIAWVWQITANNGWRLVFLVIGCPLMLWLPWQLLAGGEEYLSIWTGLLATLLGLPLLVVQIVILSLSYGFFKQTDNTGLLEAGSRSSPGEM